MKIFKNTILILVICVLCWFAVDFTLTSLGLGPWKLSTFVTGKQHDIYHHELKPNLNDKARFGNVFYQLCSDEYGFKISCQDRGQSSSKNYDVAFIGDSFTEAIGMEYEDSFVGMFAQNNPELSVVNLGFSSYAPTIYYKKVEYLLNAGFTFKHLVVGIDISDIQDEAIAYALSADGTRVIDKNSMARVVNSETSTTKEAKKKVDRPQIQDSQSVKKVEMAKKEAPVHTSRRKQKYFVEEYFEYTWYLNLIADSLLNPVMGLKRFDTSYLRAGWTHLKDLEGSYGPEGVEGGKRQAVESMTKLKKLLDAHDIKMSVMVYPWPAQLMYAPRNHAGVTLWENFCKDVNCESFINTNTAFYDAVEATSLEQVINENYIRGDFHFNKKGNALITKVLQEQLP